MKYEILDATGNVLNTIEAELEFVETHYAGMFREVVEYYPTPSPRDIAKREREAAVAAITVTTAAGNTFDGDETSQGRMARAVIALSAAPAGTTVNWVLHDNSVIQATAAELTEALALAGAAQAAIWVI